MEIEWGEIQMSNESKENKDKLQNETDKIEEQKNLEEKDKLKVLLEELDTDVGESDEDTDEEGLSVRSVDNKYIKSIVKIGAIILAFYHIYALLYKLAIPLVLYSIHWGMGLILVYLYYPAFKTKKDKLDKEKLQNFNKVPIYDLFAMGLVLATVIYILLDPNGLLMRAAKNASSSTDLIFGVIAIILSLEAARRTTGLGLPIVALVFVAYAFWGNYLPSLLAGKGYSFKRVVGFIFSIEGIYGSPIKMSAQYVFLLIIFGAFLGISGTGEFFIRLAMKLAGKGRGGPAKVAVIASGLFGSISGSAVANVVGTGVFTIPLMKKTGYKSHFAAAVEAVASTGGQILPPVMGSGAFIMSELIGWSYTSIAIGALVPALLYYIAVLIMVDLEAGKSNLEGVDTSTIPKVGVLLKQGWNLLLPLFTLIYFLVVRRSTVSRAAVYAIITSIIGCALKKSSKLSFSQIIDAIETGVVRSITVIAAVACAGVAIGAIMLSGVGAKFTYLVVQLAGGNLFLTLLLSGLATTILGMGLPTVAAYLIGASLLASGITQLGVPVFAAHMFILYYSILSQITPPVALAAYAAGNIAGANPNKVGFTSMKLGVVAFILPFFFVYGNELLLIGEPLAIAMAIVSAVIGVFCLSIGFIGWFMGEDVNLISRGLLLLAAFTTIVPGIKTDIIGILLIIAFIFLHKGTREALFRKNLKGNKAS